MTDDEKVLFQEMVDDIYDQFVGDVSKSRKIPVEKLKVIADGRVLTGRQAKKHGLIDEFGSLNKALDFARKEAKLKPDSPVILPDGEETEKLLKWFQKNLSESLSNILSDIAPENLTAFWNYFLKI